MRRPSTRFLILAALVALAWLAPVLRGGFSRIDQETLANNVAVEGKVPAHRLVFLDFWFHREPIGYWRPTTTLSLRLDRTLWDDWSPGYHLTNLLLHLGVVLLFWSLMRRLGLSREGAAPYRDPAFLALCLFAVHPVHADAIAWVSGRSAPLSLLIGLLGVRIALAVAPSGMFRVKRDLILLTVSFAAVFFAAGAREDGLLFALLIPLAARIRTSETMIASAVGACSAAGLVLVCRHMAVGRAFGVGSEVVLSGMDLTERLRWSGLAALEGLRLCLAPLGLMPRYTTNDLLPSSGYASAGAWALAGWSWVLCFAVCGLWMAISPRSRGRVSERAFSNPSPRRVIAISCAAVFLACLAVAQIIPLKDVFGGRYLYAPMLFGVPCLAGVLAFLARKRTWSLSVATCIVPVLPVMAWENSRPYRSESELLEEVLITHQGDAGLWNDFGAAHEAEKQYEEALKAYRRACEVDPRHTVAWGNRGRLLLELDRVEEARADFLHALDSDPENYIARYFLGRLQLQEDQPRLALHNFEAVVDADPEFIPAWRLLAASYHELQEPHMAMIAIERALEINPDDTTTKLLKQRIEAAAIQGPPLPR